MHDPIVPAMTENVPKDITLSNEEKAREIIAQRADRDGEHVFASEVRAGAWDHENRADIAIVLKRLNEGHHHDL